MPLWTTTLAIRASALLALSLAPSSAMAEPTRLFCGNTIIVSVQGMPSSIRPGAYAYSSWIYFAYVRPAQVGATVAGTIIFTPPQGISASRNAFSTATVAQIPIGMATMTSAGPPVADGDMLNYATVLCA